MNRRIRENIYSVGVNHWDRRLFDELIPLPDGTSYNSYLIFGLSHTVLVDTADPAVKDEFFRNLDAFKNLNVDYLISLHAEQDHSGCIPFVLERFPQCKVVTNEKCKELLITHLHINPERFHVVKDGEKLDIGGRTIEFIFTPWVHWPETMCAYLKEEKVLFSCDFFGSHLACSTLYEKDRCKLEEAAKRYFSEIMAPFRNFIRNNLKKLEPYEIEIIAPSHGPVHDETKTIIDLYSQWASEDVKNEVLLLYVSMHGSTKLLAENLVKLLSERNITVNPFNLSTADIGEVAMKALDAATIVLMTPTVLAGPHPYAAYYTIFLNAVKPKAARFGVVTSFGWGGVTVNWVKSHLTNFKGQFLEPVEIKGLASEQDFEKTKKLAEEIIESHKSLGIT